MLKIIKKIKEFLKKDQIEMDLKKLEAINRGAKVRPKIHTDFIKNKEERKE